MKKSTFDDILKQNIVDAIGFDFFGYSVNGSVYQNYYDNGSFDNFVKQMHDFYRKHYDKYIAGKGSELVSHNMQPPKMASVASSSRFCYIALRNVENIDFEHACPISGVKGTPPQMDAYIAESNTFIEVKCHEIFDAHKKNLSKQYFNILFGKDNDFGLDYIPESEAEQKGIREKCNEFEIPYGRFGMIEEPAMLDFKQLICHLLGVKSHKKEDEEATLVYLFFKPKTRLREHNDELDSVFDNLQAEIKSVFDSCPIKKFTAKNNIRLKAVVQYSEIISPLTTENMIVVY